METPDDDTPALDGATVSHKLQDLGFPVVRAGADEKGFIPGIEPPLRATAEELEKRCFKCGQPTVWYVDLSSSDWDWVCDAHVVETVRDYLDKMGVKPERPELKGEHITIMRAGEEQE